MTPEELAEARLLLARLEQVERIVTDIRRGMSPRQLELHDEPEQFRAAHPGRRAGKSEFIPRSAVLHVLRADYGETVVIGAETQKKAKMLHWAGINMLVKRHGIPLTPNVQDGTWSTPWGAKILFWGMNDKGAVELLRGFAVCAAFFDEVATYAGMLENLTLNVMEPTLATTGGPLTLCGTPSLTRSGYWFQLCAGKIPGWKVHHWTLRENPFWKHPKFKTADAYLADLREKRGWEEDNTTYQREYMGRFVDDTSAQVFKLVRERNVKPLPKSYDAATWIHTMGIDFGYSPDPCAWVVLASPPREKTTYVIHAEARLELSQDQAAEVTRALVDEYKPSQVVGDVNGAGKGYVETYNKRYGARAGAYIQNAKKGEKLVQIDVVNTELRTGRLIICDGMSEELAGQMESLPWKDAHRQRAHPEYPDDMCDAARYALIAHKAYAHEPIKPVEPPPRWTTLDQRAAKEKADKQRDWWDTRVITALAELTRRLVCGDWPVRIRFALPRSA